MNKVLTKSKYILGLECPRHLWITFNHPEKIRQVTLAEEFKFSEGDKVGQLAKTLFSDGIDLPVESYTENLQQTKEAIKKGKPLFEAGFAFENCFSRADILVPVGKEWDIIEVKSGTEVKDINVHDVSFQKYVYEANGLKIRKCFLMHLNKEYFRKGKLDAKKLLNNNMVERYHNEFREFDKVRRGFKSDETAQQWSDAFRLYHNFIKKHMALNGATPSQVAEIDIDLGRNRWLSLLKQSLNHPNTTKKEVILK